MSTKRPLKLQRILLQSPSIRGNDLKIIFHIRTKFWKEIEKRIEKGLKKNWKFSQFPSKNLPKKEEKKAQRIPNPAAHPHPLISLQTWPAITTGDGGKGDLACRICSVTGSIPQLDAPLPKSQAFSVTLWDPLSLVSVSHWDPFFQHPDLWTGTGISMSF